MEQPHQTQQKQFKDRPRYISISIPHIAQPIKVPKKISQLVYQMNIRGYKTQQIRWGAPIEIDLCSHQDFIDHLVKHRRTDKKEIRDFHKYLVEEIDFKLRVHPPQSKKHEPVILTLLLKHSQVKKFEKMFYSAFIKRRS